MARRAEPARVEGASTGPAALLKRGLRPKWKKENGLKAEKKKAFGQQKGPTKPPTPLSSARMGEGVFKKPHPHPETYR